MATQTDSKGVDAYRRRHLRLGWWLIAGFGALGLVLEALHGFKTPWYMGVAYEARRTMFTLGHAHGTLLGLLNVAWAASLPLFPAPPGKATAVASVSLTAGSVLLPCGFVLGGVWIFSGDPGLGVVLVPLGAGLVMLALALIAVQASRR